jgi:hypothetical protein
VEVSYKTTLDDFVAYTWHMWWKSKTARRGFLSQWLALPAVGLVAAGTLLAAGSWVGSGVSAGLSLLYAVVFPFSYCRSAKNGIREYAKELGGRGVIGSIRLILSEESLVEITELTRSEARWRDMQGIEEFGDYTIILVTEMTAAIIPRHGFERDEDYFCVREYARERIKGRAEQSAAADRPRDIRFFVL